MRGLICVMLFLTSCQVYRSNFDRCPAEGIPCRSVSEIEGMIIESSEGSDVLVEKDPNCQVVFRKNQPYAKGASQRCRRIWIPPKKNCSGVETSGHYVFLPEEKRGN